MTTLEASSFLPSATFLMATPKKYVLLAITVIRVVLSIKIIG